MSHKYQQADKIILLSKNLLLIKTNKILSNNKILFMSVITVNNLSRYLYQLKDIVDYHPKCQQAVKTYVKNTKYCCL